MTADAPHTRILVAGMVLTALALGGLAFVIVEDASAQAEQSTLDQLSDADSEAVLAGLRGRVAGWVNARLAWLGGDETTSADACGDLQAEFNDHNTSIEEWVNNRTNASAALDVVALTCDTSEEPATVYLTADVNTTSENYTNAAIVDSTDREADAECVLTEDAADNAADELATFVDEFATTGDDVSESFRTRLAAQYAGDVSCDGVAGVS